MDAYGSCWLGKLLPRRPVQHLSVERCVVWKKEVGSCLLCALRQTLKSFIFKSKMGIRRWALYPPNVSKAFFGLSRVPNRRADSGSWGVTSHYHWGGFDESSGRRYFPSRRFFEATMSSLRFAFTSACVCVCARALE